MQTDKEEAHVILFRVQGSNIALVGAHLRVRPKSGQTRRSAPTEVSSLAHWTGNSYPLFDRALVSDRSASQKHA
jgi:hypothetical protein